MVKLFISTLLVIVAAVVLTLYFDLLGDPGYLLLAWRNYTFETSLFALIVFLIVAAVLLRLLWMILLLLNPLRLLRAVHLPGTGAKHSVQSRTREGLLYFVRSDWANAHRFLERSFKDKDCSLVNFLAAAYAACETGQHDTWENHLTQAARKYPESLSIVNTVRADLLMRVGHLEQSLAVLEQVRKKSDKDRQLLVLLKEAYLQLKDWQRLENLMPALKKAEAVNDEEFLQLQKLLFEADLHRQIEQLSSQEQISDDDRQNLMKSWNKAPHKYHDDPEVVEDFVRRLTGIGANQEAAQVIEAALGKFWNDRLVEIYGELDSVDYTFQLTQAEEWLQQNPNNAGLLLTLGRISLRNEQRDKANDYLQKSIDIEPSAAAYDELNRLKALQ